MTIAPPLRPWFWCIGWLLLIWLLITGITARMLPAYHAYLSSTASPETHAPAPGDCRTILALGDSLLGYSLPDPRTFNDVLNGGSLGPGAQDICWRHRWLGRARLRAFDALRAAPGTQDGPVYDLLVLQDSLLLNYDKAFDNEPFPRKAKRVLGFLVQTSLLGAPSAPPVQEVRDDLPRFTAKALAQFRSTLRASYQASAPLPAETIEALRRWQALAKRLVVLHIPRSPALEGGAAQQAWLDHLRARLSPLGIDLAVLGRPLPSDHYIDHSHPNALGRKIRSRQIAELLGERS